MQIHQIFNENSYRNFTYLLVDEENFSVICIDPFEALTVQQYLEENSLSLISIINTHQHWDHIRGNEGLIKKYECKVYDENNLVENQIIEHGQEKLEIHFTPGHTAKHFCILLRSQEKYTSLFCGDTLFNSGAGNCKNGGDPDALFETYKSFIHKLPQHMKIYPGHDYLETNLKFTLSLMPENKWAQQELEEYQKHGYQVKTLEEERKYNLFLLGHITESADQKNEFIRLRALRDTW